MLFPDGSVTFLFPGEPAIDWNCVRNRGGVEGIVCPGKNGLDRDWGGGVEGRFEPEATGKTFWNLVACSDSRD